MSKVIVCFGEALIDFHDQGQPGEGHRFVPFAGGAPANVAVATAKLGTKARFIGMLSHDPFGDLLLDSLQQAGVDTRDVVRTAEANTALAFVTLDEGGDRSFTFYRPPAADLLFREAHYREESFSDAAIFHVCSNSMTEPAMAKATRHGMERAQHAGALVSFDVNLRPALWARDEDPKPTIWQALALADLVKLSGEEFDFLAADTSEAKVLERLWQGRSRLLIVTDGGAKVRWFTPDAQGELPSYKVEVVDTTAAGDAFVGGLLSRLRDEASNPAALARLILDRQALETVLRYATACGALTVTRKGSFVALPTTEEIERFMAEHAGSTASP